MTSHFDTCGICGNKGIVLICYNETQDYDAAACTCRKGQYWRMPKQLKAWAASQKPQPVRIGRLEEFYTEAAIAKLSTVMHWGPTIAEMFGEKVKQA